MLIAHLKPIFFYLGIKGKPEFIQIPALHETEARIEFVRNTNLPYYSSEIIVFEDTQIPVHLRRKLKINIDEVSLLS